MSLNKSKALRTAEKYVLQGKIPAAIEEYRKVADADPSDLTTINTLGDLYVRAGRISNAIMNFSRIAESYRETGFTLKAIAMLKKISKLDPTNIETSMKLANLYSQQGLLVEARQQYLQVADAYARAGQTRKALEAYQKIADLDPSNTSVRMKLGEIFSREGMLEEAHESFIMAGAEFLRKGDSEQALNANLKAIAINPESRQGLTAIASIYTERGHTDRAINILCDAFERNPGDIEILTILGRTYLSAGLMDEAERTFLSLVELDRNRYHYLLEVGRRFLQMGDLDRAAEQIDGCLDVLIGKREEDKAIDFLRRILDREMNHIGSLKRLAQIFLRIREDHNLISALNSLAEAALREGDEKEAIDALKELVRLEPDDPIHRQRLYNLGVRDLIESDSPDVVRATGPLDYQSAAFDDAFVIRQISEAEILAGHGQIDHAVGMLGEILNHAPENVQVHLKLKDIYLRAGFMDKAALECLELARIHEGRGEAARASDYLAEAQQLNPLLDMPTTPVSEVGQDGNWFAPAPGRPAEAGGPSQSGGAFEVFEPTGSLDLSRYQTGALGGHGGFVTAPEAASAPNESQESGAGFRYGDTIGPGTSDQQNGSGASSQALFKSAGEIPSDTVSRALRDELEGIDFYIAQGYVEIARDSLDRLKGEHGDHPEVIARYNRLGVKLETSEEERRAEPAPDAVEIDSTTNPASEDAGDLSLESNYSEGDLTVDVERTPEEGEKKNVMPFLIQKESGQLDPDLIVKFNTSELLNQTAFDFLKPATGHLEPQPVRPQTATNDLIESLVSDMEESLETEQPEPEALSDNSETEVSQESAEPHPGQDLVQILEELKENTGELKAEIDFETYYSLGLAYKDMDLLDDAIEQFQMAYKTSAFENQPTNTVQCCHMLGVCFVRKSMPKVAVMWFERGLAVAGRPEDEYQALRYEIGQCFEELGEVERAIDVYMRVYAIDLNYRQVGGKIARLQALRNA